ncbi:MAG: hypothetical protein ACR2N5_06210, partial [Solirubrobacterales bacterium]
MSKASTYVLYGLLVESELPLDAPIADGAPDYRFELAEERVASGAPEGKLVGEVHHGGFSFWCAEAARDADIWVLRYGDVGDIEFNRASRVLTVYPVPGQTPELFGALIGGGVLSFVLAADGELVMHASAVETAGEVLAIIGASGAGKTTTAALMCAAGARLVSDDALRIAAGEPNHCYAGTNTLRLRPAAAELADSIAGATLTETVDGRIGATPLRSAESGLPLRAFLLPQPSHEAEELRIERLSPKEGLVQLISNPRVISWREPAPLR